MKPQFSQRKKTRLRVDTPHARADAIADELGLARVTCRKWIYRPGGIRAGLLSWFQRQQLAALKGGDI